MANPKQRQQQLGMVGGIAAIAVVVVVIAIVLGQLTQDNVSRSGIDYSEIPHEQLEDGTYVLGDPNARVTIVEFADFLCPFCQDYKDTVDQVIEDLVIPGHARFEFRTYPALGPDSVVYAQWLQCAGEIGGPVTFWEAHEELFIDAANNVRSADVGQNLADRLDLDYIELLECSAEADEYRTNIQIGDQAGVTGTPSVMMRIDGGPLTSTGMRGGIGFETLRDFVAQYADIPS
jgi:protein-disulfide isomerase